MKPRSVAGRQTLDCLNLRGSKIRRKYGGVAGDSLQMFRSSVMSDAKEVRTPPEPHLDRKMIYSLIIKHKRRTCGRKLMLIDGQVFDHD